MATSSAHDDGVPRMVALCYVRQSVTRQGVPQRSPEQQRANIEAVCAQHGWQPLWFVEAKGHRSGFGEAQRPAWRRLKERLHLPGVAALVANWPEYGGLVGVKRAKDRIAVAPDAFAMAFVPEHTLFPAALLERVAAVAAQRRQVHRCRAPAHTLALSGLCRCAHCAACADGSPALHLHSHWRRGVPHYIHPPGTHCHAHTRSRPAEHVEHEVGRLIDLLCLPAEALTALVRQANSEREDTEDGEYHRQRVILEARLARIRELYLTLEMDQAEYRARMAACREALHKLDTRPTAAEQGVALQACAQDIEQLHIAWRSGTNAEHNTALRRVFQDITVDLESGHITAFHLDVLAAPYLIPRPHKDSSYRRV